MSDKRCPSWHFLPGPYQDEDERTSCPNADTHAEQAWQWHQQEIPRTTS